MKFNNDIIVDIHSLLSSKDIENFDKMIKNYSKDDDMVFELFPNWLNSTVDKLNIIKTMACPIHKILRKAFGDIIIPLIDEGVEFIPAFGTLLGIVRSNSIIPHDDDLDFFLDYRSFIKFKGAIIDKAHSKGWNIKEEKWPIIHNGNDGEFVFKLYSEETIVFDFGKYLVKYKPTIDVFPSMRISENFRKKYFRKKNKLFLNISNLEYKSNKRIDRYSYYERIGSQFNKKLNFNKFIKSTSINKSEKFMNNFIRKNESFKENEKFFVPLFHDCIKMGIMDLSDMEKHNFYNLLINIPRNYNQILNDIYGNWSKVKEGHIHIVSWEGIYEK